MKEEAPGGADVVIDTTGDHRIFPRCRDLIRHEGRIAMQGYYPDPIQIDFHPTHLTAGHGDVPVWVGRRVQR